MKTFPLQVVTPEGTVFEGEAESLLCHTVEGDVEILAGHTELFAPLGIGRARIRVAGEDKQAFSSGGFLSVMSGKAVLCAITFEYAENIDLERAKRAKQKAEAAILAAKDEKTQRLAKAKLARALSRISVKEG